MRPVIAFAFAITALLGCQSETTKTAGLATRASTPAKALSSVSPTILAECGPIALEFQVVGSSASGRVDLIFELKGTQAAARLANFKTNSLTSSPEGPVADLVVNGNAVAFKTKTGFSYDLVFDGCKLVKGSGQGDHPQAGRIWLTVTS